MLEKKVVLDLTYNALANQVSLFQQQRKLTNDEIEGILIRILHDVQTARIVESANTILELTQRIEEFEKKESENNKPDQEEGT
ncbi:MAG: hypothetical protein IIZ78_18230 [Clostridiales bacterium]|nr:hypothetical protein [Clostridiales bacterium]